MRVLWPHNFDPAQPNSQVFMNIAAGGLRAAGVDVHCEFLGNLRSVTNMTRARRRIRAMAAEFDVIHAQYGSACGFATSAVRNVPKVLSIRGNDWNVHEEIGFHYFHTRLARAMTWASLGSYDVILTVSRRVAADVGRFTRATRVEAMPSPLDLGRFVPINRVEARVRLGFPDAAGERWVLFNAINLDDPIKRFPLAQRVFDIANAKSGGNLRLRVATGLPHSELPLFTAACDVILCTSETEGWPNCVKEALACNVPFVATDVSDLRDIAVEDPACRVCSDDPEALAAALCDALEQTRDLNVRRHVESMDLHATTRRLIGIYESLIGRGANSASSSN